MMPDSKTPAEPSQGHIDGLVIGVTLALLAAATCAHLSGAWYSLLGAGLACGKWFTVLRDGGWK
jgi:heme A synthase